MSMTTHDPQVIGMKVPGDWKIQRLGDLGEIRGRVGWKGYTKKDLTQSGALAIGGRQMGSNCRLDLSEPVYLSRAKFIESPDIAIKKGDVLIAQRGTLGKIALVDQEIGDATINPSLVIFRPRIICPIYATYFLASAAGQRQINEVTSKTGVPMISQRQIENMVIARPSCQGEETLIAEVLEDIELQLSLLDEALTKKQNIKQAAMQELLTGKRRLPGLEGEWEVMRLGDIAEVDPENLGGNTQADYQFNYISLEDVEQGRLRSYSEQTFPSAPSRARRRLRHNDVLISTVRPNLRSHLLFNQKAGEWVCSTGFAVLRCHDETTNPSYIYFQVFADFINRQIDALLTGSNYPAINSRDVRSLQIPCPSLHEQTAIVRVLSEIDGELEALEQQLGKTRELKQGMMQQLLTGKIRLQ